MSWTPNTQDKVITPNKEIATDWGIINKQLIQGKNNVFALFPDLNTGWLAVYPQPNRGLAGEALESYCKDYGSHSTILSDNAAEYVHGTFETLCKKKEITEVQRSPHPESESSRTLHGYSNG
jgi:hypothetical protein